MPVNIAVRSLLSLLLLALPSLAQDRVHGIIPGQNVQSWRFWWEYNRETFAEFRAAPRDALGAQRAVVRRALRLRARYGDGPARRKVAIVEGSLGDKPRLRTAAILALGRLADDRDIWLLLEMLKNQDERVIVKQACVLALAARPTPTDPKTAALLRERLAYWVKTGRTVFKPKDSFGFVIMRKPQPTTPHLLLAATAGLHAPGSPAILDAYVTAIRRPPRTTHEYANALAIGCGLARSPMLVPELIGAVRGEHLGRKKLNDIARSDATAALARQGAVAVAPLLHVLDAPKTGIQTRRAAALGLGRLLRAGDLGKLDAQVERSLRTAMSARSQPILAGFAAIALGAAERPRQVPLMIKLLKDARVQVRRPYIALALGLAARRNPSQKPSAIQNALVEALKRAKEAEFEAALCIACGLARADRAIPLLLRRVEKPNPIPIVYQAAVQGLGLLGRTSQRTSKALLKTLHGGRIDLLEDAAVALHMLGEKTVGPRLHGIRKAAKGTSSRRALKVAVMQALARIRSGASIAAMVRRVEDHQETMRVREAAATTLGWLASRMARDPLTEMHADYNFHARSQAMKDLSWLCGAYQTITLPTTKSRSG